MITQEEIDAKAQEFQIHTANVQRDYVFGWILFVLFTKSPLRDKVFLKGGNALRKGYFSNTRFSPDLDFGTPGEIPSDKVLAAFSEIGREIEAKAGVKFMHEEHRIAEWYPVADGQVTELKVYDVRVYFQDFYGNADHIKIRVSIDFTRYDRVLLPLQTKQLIHPYSDAALVVCEMPCMKLEEIIASKLKCLLQRQHAPDLFDYVYSIKLLGHNLDRKELVTTFIRKTIFDKNPLFAKELLTKSPMTLFKNVWNTSIVCAKQVAMEAEEAISAYMKDLNDLFSIFPSHRYSSFEYFGPELRNPIMQAGRELTCLSITYNGIKRLVEPYALKYMQKKSGEEREYLYVWDRTGGRSEPGPKSLVAQNFTSIENTTEKFEPRWPVELSKSGEIPDNHFFFDPNRPARSPTRRSPMGIQYSYRCPICGKTFKRTTMDGRLNSHKNKNGYPCFGTYGIYVGTS